MKRYSVNGKLIPSYNRIITDEYTGHFLKVSYIQEIAGNSVYSKDRVNVEAGGSFIFFVPKESLLSGEMVTIEVYAPDGEMLGKQIYSYGSLNISLISESVDDESEILTIKVNPKEIEFNTSSPAVESYKKTSGKIIDLSGERKAFGLQVIVMVSSDSSTEFTMESFTPLFSAVTDREGYFFGQIGDKTYKQAYGVIAGLESQPVVIALENDKLPKNIILVTDLSALSEERVENQVTPALPDSDDLVNSPSFSQDLGGKCIDFTIPNRTLEEFSFYHTVRTTEPEIKGLTITAKESKKIKYALFDISDTLFTLSDTLNSSFTTLSVTPYVIDKPIKGTLEENTRDTNMTEAFEVYTPPVYQLSIASGSNTFKLSTKDLLAVNNGLKYADMINILAEQEKRRKKLLELHHRLSAAYCGKHGVQEAKSYCETLTSKVSINRKKVNALLENLTKSQGFLELDENIKKELSRFSSKLAKLIKKSTIEEKTIKLHEKSCQTLIEKISNSGRASEEKKALLEDLKKISVELVKAGENQFSDFELCSPSEKTANMGILCLMKEFDDIKETLLNTPILSLGEILKIRSYYDIFLSSITAFITLLEEFYTFYNTASKLMVSLEDTYFVENYLEIKSTLHTLKREIYRAIYKIEEIKMAYISNHPGRRELSVENSIDWDETPTVYENTTIAHGHILHFKQKWKADGYSLGDLLYSLPLAPCQEKQIAIIDWDREETGSRTEEQAVSESLQASISRDRDISEIARSAFNENINASSTNKTSSTSGGIGGGIGGILGGIGFGVFGGVSSSGASSRSTSHQDASRNLAASSLNRLRDNVTQSASSLRGQRSTVIQTVGQNEDVRVQTEVVKNNNHCHAMTVEYFEVLKHYALEQELADVQECLYVPLPMSHFDHKKVLRWSNTLRRVMYGKKLIRGFDAIERIDNNYANSDLPLGTYSSETIEMFSGHFTISFDLVRPYIEEIEDATKRLDTVQLFFPWVGVGLGGLIGAGLYLNRKRSLTEDEKNAMFEKEYAPDIVRSFIDTLQVDAISENGTEIDLDFDLTLLSNYRKGAPVKVSIASKNTGDTITREQIKYIRFRANTDVESSSRIILRSVYLHYTTKHLNESIVRNSRVNNDIINSSKVKGETKTDAALLYTPLSNKERRNPRQEDREAASALISFLNEHLEMSHKIIWSSMDASRLFGLLDGYIAPNSGGKSVASVVENKIIGIIGNNLILKVVPGERLDPVFKKVEDLFAYYRTATKPDPFRISVPTKGVYAESVMGKCISCEEIDETKHWRFDDVPCSAKPTAINPISTDSRRSDPGDLQPKDMPTNIVTMQTAPTAPDPTGLTAAYNLLGKSGIFGDMTGLKGTQANALSALQTTSKSVTDLAAMSKDIVGSAVDFQKQKSMKKDIGKTLKTIQKAEKEKQISADQAKELSYTALSSMAGKPTPAKKLTEEKEVKEAIKSASDKKKDIKIDRGSESVEIKEAKTGGVSSTSFDYTVPGVVPIVAQPSSMTCWATVATMLMSWKDEVSYSIQTAMDDAGAIYRTKFDNNKGLLGSEHEAFATACGFNGEPPMCYTVSGLRALIETHGPLIAVADEAPGDPWAIHARVIYGIYGDGTVDNTFLRINDPAGGRQYSESFKAFSQKYEEVADAPRLQIMHY